MESAAKQWVNTDVLFLLCIEVSKVLSKLAKEKGCKVLLPWVKTCSNHLYWSATSTCDGNGQVIRAKFESFFHHIVKMHTNLPNSLFNKWAHKEDTEERTWLNKGMNLLYTKNIHVVQQHNHLKC